MQPSLQSPFLSALGRGMGCFSSSPPVWPVPAGAAVGFFPSHWSDSAGRGNLRIRYPPCFLPEGKCFAQLAQSPVPDAGSSQASLACIEGPGQETDVAAARGEEAGPCCTSLGRCASQRGVAGRVRAKWSQRATMRVSPDTGPAEIH